MAKPLRIPLGKGETITSYVSRLALFHDVRFKDLCLDLELDHRDIFLGTDAAIGVISSTFRASKNNLKDYSFIRDGQEYLLGDQRISNHDATRQHLRICVSCVLEDLRQVGGRLPRHLVPFSRSEWSLRSIRSCHIHRESLIKLPCDAGQYPYDFSAALRPHLPKLDGFIGDSEGFCQSALEVYLHDRLSGLSGAHAFLDSMPFYAAANLCEMLGMVAMHGVQVVTHSKNEAEWRQAGDAGFAVAKDGDSSIRALFARISPPQTKYARQWGPRSAFGRLYTWLSNETHDAAYDPVRDLIRDHCSRNMPLSADARVFGKADGRRHVHTLRSIAKDAKMHPKRLKKVLLARGHIAQDSAGVPDGDLIIPDHDVMPIIMAAKNAMSVAQAAIYLNVPRRQVDFFIEYGLLDPLVRPGPAKLGAFGILTTDMDRLLARLDAGCEEIDAVQRNQVSVEGASRRTHAATYQVIQMILGDRLRWKGKLKGTRGLRSIIINIDEVKLNLISGIRPGLSMREAERALSTSYYVLQNLVQGGFLTALDVRNPITNYPQRAIKPSEIERFKATYISLTSIARSSRVSPERAKKLLTARGITPAFPAAVGAIFYRKAECDLN
nr:TniQ family protein [uncultured Dongia sp.]